MKRAILTAFLAIVGFSASADAACQEASPYNAGPSNVTVAKLNVNFDGNAYALLSDGNTYWIEGADVGAHAQYQFLLVAWQMGTSFDVSTWCTWAGFGQRKFISILSR